MKMTWKLQHDQFLRIGYRTPGLSRELDPRGKMQLAVELGMEVVEPQNAPHEIATVEDAKALGRAAAEFKIRIPSMGTFLPMTEPNATGDIIAKLNIVLEMAREMGVNYLFVLAPHPAETIPQPQAWTILVDNMRRCEDIVSQAGLTLAMEPEWFIGSAERLARLIRLVGRPKLRPNFDATNLYLNGSDPVEAFNSFGDAIICGHIKDGTYRGIKPTEVEVGQGEVDYPAIFDCIFKRGKSINLFIEHCGKSSQVRAAANYIHNVVEQACARRPSTGT